MTYAEQLVKKWRHILADSLPTWTEPASLALCCEIASRSSVMVEFGTYIGASADVMLRANKDLHLWCVDIFTAFEFNMDVAARFLAKPIQEGRCELIKGDSQRAIEMLPHMLRQIDAIWVDDGHATEDVKRDIFCGLRLLRDGGTIFGHDYDTNPLNDVALGVCAGLPVDKIRFPVPRCWSYTKP